MNYEKDDYGFVDLALRPRSDIEIITFEEEMSLEAWRAPRLAAIRELERERMEEEIKELEEEIKRYKEERAQAEEDSEAECIRAQIAIEDLMKEKGISWDKAHNIYYDL